MSGVTTELDEFFRGQGRLDDGDDPQLNASAQYFASCGTTRRNDSRTTHVTHDGVRTEDLKE